MTHLVLPGYELMTTHSNVYNLVEFGILFRDRSGAFWSQVDTVLTPLDHCQQRTPSAQLLVVEAGGLFR